MQRSSVGVGPVLRRARVARRVTLEEASRDTRIRRDILQALEAEAFESLLGDVYIRGSIRSYATYLGLPSDRLVRAYARFAAEPPEAPAPVGRPALETPIVDAPRRRDSHRLFVMIAATLLVLAAAFGVISTRPAAPPPADMSPGSLRVSAGRHPILAVVAAEQQVGVTVTADGGRPRTFGLRPGESRSFDADSLLTIRLDHGASARVTVNGADEGFPGRPHRPWQKTYRFAPTPSPAA